MRSEYERKIRANPSSYPEQYQRLLAKDRAKKQRRMQDPERRAAEVSRLALVAATYGDKRRGRNPVKAEQRSKERYAERSFVAVDGEGWNLPAITRKRGRGTQVLTPSRHVLTVLGSSAREAIYNGQGLPTEDCLLYLLSLGGKDKVVVGYRFSYDVNMILRDLKHSAIAEICAEKWGSFWGSDGSCYRIRYTPNKSLYVVKGRFQEGEWKKECSVVVWDTFGFFQSSFLKALEEWKIGAPEEHEQIQAGKLGRQEFDETQKDSIIAYNDLECKLLVEMMNEVRNALTDCGIRVSRWDGAGAIASALHKKHGTKSHMPAPGEWGEGIRDLLLRAFYGARVEMLSVGDHDNVYGHDINSAYPSTIVDLPTLAGGQWREVFEYDNGANDCAIWEVTWNVGTNPEWANDPTELRNEYYPLTPFPWRTKEGILYPKEGRGVYWGSLVKVAIDAWGPDRIRVVRGWVFMPMSEEIRPFSWVREMYELRKVCRDTGKGKVLKLGYNSLYGKFAQGVGYREDGTPPPYQNYCWAGMITAHCQARILDAALQAPREVVAIATDGLFCRKRVDVPESKELGEWEVKEYEHMFILQPGVYMQWEKRKEGWHPPLAFDCKKRTRGFSPNDLDPDEVLRLWEKERGGLKLVFYPTRFLGMHICNHWGKLETHWCQWTEKGTPYEMRRLITAPYPGVSSGTYMDDKAWMVEGTDFSRQFYTCHPQVQPEHLRDSLPAKYVPKGQVNLDPAQVEQVIIERDQP